MNKSQFVIAAGLLVSGLATHGVCANDERNQQGEGEMEGAKIVSFYGYDDCIELSNAAVRVVLCPAAGGRVLEYALDGTNILYLPDGNEGWRMTAEDKRGRMDAGRFDIGPEKMVRRGKVLWMGPWKGEVIGDHKARMTSQYDSESGVRLIREFELDKRSSRLRCTQTISNESDRRVDLCHWSRTFAVGGGVAVVPRSPRGRFPKGVVMYESGVSLTIDPEDPSIQVTDEAVMIPGPPEFPKLGFDSHAGWLAYLAPTDQLFVKRFRTYPNRAYNEFAGLTISVWYPEGEMVELEPIGPAEDLRPGQSASFTEEWWLLKQSFPNDPHQLQFEVVKDLVEKQTEPPRKFSGPVTSPQVNSDRTVTFRLPSGDASEVLVRVAGKQRAMNLDANGVWSHTTEPLPPGLHDYTFLVDGVQVTDPHNRVVKKWLTCASMVEVLGEPAPLTQQQDVPHGNLHHHLYNSSTTGRPRNAIVYTPPGYEGSSSEKYPLLVLCHGFGDDETAWSEVGRMHQIMDNLISQKKIEPLVVVMPYGHPVPLVNRWTEDYGASNSEAMVGDVVQDLLPMVSQRYRVMDAAEYHAIAGLSMGGGHAIEVGLRHPEVFQWVGAFSAATPQGDLATEHRELLKHHQDGEDWRLFWIACGVDDFLLERNRKFNEQLNQFGIQHEYLETEGGHQWQVWRDYLPTFLSKIFRE